MRPQLSVPPSSRHYTQGGVRRIPIDEEHVRSLNLAVSAGVGEGCSRVKRRTHVARHVTLALAAMHTHTEAHPNSERNYGYQSRHRP